MNLIYKTILYYLVIALLVFSVGGFVAYSLISDEIAKETDYYMNNSLKLLQDRLARAIDHGVDLQRRFNTHQVNIRELSEVPADTMVHFSDTIAMHPHLNQLETMRKLTVSRKIRDRYLEIVMMDVIVEDSDIYESVVQIIVRLFAIFAFVMLLSTFLLSRSLLRPFKVTLEKIQKFNVRDNESLQLPKTSTTEFRQLNELLQDMSDRAIKEYQLLKKFGENASHEIQTPLAIAMGKLELLADAESLTERQFLLADAAKKSLKKVSQLGQSLSLLTKIENREFALDEEVNFSQTVQEAIFNFKELIDMKDLKFSHQIASDVNLKLNGHLATILVNNLLQNAVRHNIEDGYIEVFLDQTKLTVKNSGPPLTMPTHQLFNRFQKDTTNTHSSGLGLAIVKEICDYHNMKISYMYNVDHEINIEFL